MVVTVYWLPFAVCSRGTGTMSDTIACDALANTTSQAPSPNAITASTGMSTWPSAARTVMPATMTACSACERREFALA
jgi:hypothetical protein